MLIYLLTSTVVLLVIVVLAQLIHAGHVKAKHAKALDEQEYSVHKSSFEDGWNSVLNEYSVMRNAIRKLEQARDK